MVNEQPRPLASVPDNSEPKTREPRFDDIREGLRVLSSDYGTGTVVAVLGIGIQIHWDKPILGTVSTHLLVHELPFVSKLERI